MLLMLARCHRFMSQNLGGNDDIGLQNYIKNLTDGKDIPYARLFGLKMRSHLPRVPEFLLGSN